MPLRIEPLGRGHRALLREFRNQQPDLELYLRRFALRHAKKDLLARTYLALDGDRVAGFFSLAVASVERGAVVALPDVERLPRFPIPAVLLARLAVDIRAQGQGLGRFLFDEALGRAMDLARFGPVGVRLFVTDAIDEQAAGFYERQGLIRISRRFPCRMVLDLAPLVGR